MFFGLTIEKLMLIALIAALIVGPERLPRYAEGLARLISRGKEYVQGAKTRVRDEMGPEFDDVDWKKLDPRQYDPRRIIREALLDDTPVAPVKASAVGAMVAASSPTPTDRPAFTKSDPPPYDSEAT